MLVLDEPTSSLDVQSEALIRDVGGRLAPRTTVFVIAHRLSTLDICDRIMVIYEGRLQGFDTPGRLEAEQPLLPRGAHALRPAVTDESRAAGPLADQGPRPRRRRAAPRRARRGRATAAGSSTRPPTCCPGSSTSSASSRASACPPTASGCATRPIPAGCSGSPGCCGVGRFDVVHAHSPVSASLARVLVRAGFRSTAFVYTEHNRWPSHHPATRALNRADLRA